MANTDAYIRGQVVGAGLVNVVLDPALEWVLDRNHGFQSVPGVVAALAARSGWLGLLLGVLAAVVVVAVGWILDRGRGRMRGRSSFSHPS